MGNAENPPPTLLHLPTPGDHFSPSTGSATMTVIDGLSRQHHAEGGRSVVAVGRGTYSDRYPSAEVVEYPLGSAPSRALVRAEALLARFGRPRQGSTSQYLPALGALGGFDGVLLVHNGPPAPLALTMRHRRGALYCHNLLFRTYSRAELRRITDCWDAFI